MLSRRNLIAAAICAGAAVRLDRRASIRVGGRGVSGYGTLALLCVDLACPLQMARACLQALPEIERSPRCLARTILEAAASTGNGWASLTALRHAVRDKSRADFDHDKVVDVEGWILSLTETRVYALASIWAENARNGPSRLLD